VKTVQVAIPDPEYADALRNLLSQDGIHRVHLVQKPDVALAGVILVDATELENLSLRPSEQARVIVLVRKGRDDLAKIWNAGVRHVLFQGDSPHSARVVVLGMELGLCWTGSNPPSSREVGDTQKPNRGPLESSRGSTRRGQCRGRRTPPRH
jgi:hypothetical protein